ncbi:MAG TPA: 50S ribosomal protein L4 [Patescibacteria group bacterium]|jgi:large subunit ribosomal protein L4|nr:50S ribosomal protein L4 [Patescibacteria group bacterium]
MKISVYNQKAEVTGEIELNEKIFGIKPTLHLLAEAVRIQASNARKGLANTKTRGEVSGGGKKPWKQKGTGRARVGSIRSPIWRHGGITFGPTSDRNWSLKINKKAKTKALFMSLSDKVTDGKLIIVDGMDVENAKTKNFIQIMASFESKLNTLGKKQLLVMPKKEMNLVRASRNIPHFSSTLANSLNVTDILKADTCVILKDSLAVIEKTYLKENANYEKSAKSVKAAAKKTAAKTAAPKAAAKAPAKTPAKAVK